MMIDDDDQNDQMFNVQFNAAVISSFSTISNLTSVMTMALPKVSHCTG